MAEGNDKIDGFLDKSIALIKREPKNPVVVEGTPPSPKEKENEGREGPSLGDTVATVAATLAAEAILRKGQEKREKREEQKETPPPPPPGAPTKEAASNGVSWSRLYSRLDLHVAAGRRVDDEQVMKDILLRDQLVEAADHDDYIDNIYGFAGSKIGGINIKLLTDTENLRQMGLTRDEVIELIWSDIMDHISSLNPRALEEVSMGTSENLKKYKGMHEAYQRYLVHAAEKALMDAEVVTGLRSQGDPALAEVVRKTAIIGFGPVPGTIRAVAGEYAKVEKRQAEQRQREEAEAAARGRGEGYGDSTLAEQDWSLEHVVHDESFFDVGFLKQLGIPATVGDRPDLLGPWVPVDVVGVFNAIAAGESPLGVDAVEKRLLKDTRRLRMIFPQRSGEKVMTDSERLELFHAFLSLLQVVGSDNGTLERLAGKEGITSILEKFNEGKVARLFTLPGFERAKTALGMFFSFETPVAGVQTPDGLKDLYNSLKNSRCTTSDEWKALKVKEKIMIEKMLEAMGNDVSYGEVYIAYEFFKLFGTRVMNHQFGKLADEFSHKPEYKEDTRINILHSDGLTLFTGVVNAEGTAVIGIYADSDNDLKQVVKDDSGKEPPGKGKLWYPIINGAIKVRLTDEDLDLFYPARDQSEEIIKENIAMRETMARDETKRRKELGFYLARGGVDLFLARLQETGGPKLKSMWGDVLAMRTNVGEIGRMVRRQGKYEKMSSADLLSEINKLVDEQLRKPPPSTLIHEETAKRLRNQKIKPQTQENPITSIGYELFDPRSDFRQILNDYLPLRAVSLMLGFLSSRFKGKK